MVHERFRCFVKEGWAKSRRVQASLGARKRALLSSVAKVAVEKRQIWLISRTQNPVEGVGGVIGFGAKACAVVAGFAAVVLFPEFAFAAGQTLVTTSVNNAGKEGLAVAAGALTLGGVGLGIGAMMQRPIIMTGGGAVLTGGAIALGVDQGKQFLYGGQAAGAGFDALMSIGNTLVSGWLF